MQECTQSVLCACSLTEGRAPPLAQKKTLDNIFGNLIIFGVTITAHTELNYFSLDTMCTSKFTHFALASKSHLDLNHT